MPEREPRRERGEREHGREDDPESVFVLRQRHAADIHPEQARDDVDRQREHRHDREDVEAAVVALVDERRELWSTAFLVGAIYTIRPDLDLDAGAQLTRSTTPSHAVLFGVTYRFAP
jgi:hypothetical protein